MLSAFDAAFTRALVSPGDGELALAAHWRPIGVSRLAVLSQRHRGEPLGWEPLRRRTGAQGSCEGYPLPLQHLQSAQSTGSDAIRPLQRGRARRRPGGPIGDVIVGDRMSSPRRPPSVCGVDQGPRCARDAKIAACCGSASTKRPTQGAPARHSTALGRRTRQRTTESERGDAASGKSRKNAVCFRTRAVTCSTITLRACRYDGGAIGAGLRYHRNLQPPVRARWLPQAQ